MRPPRWAEALLRAQLNPCEEEMVVGDLREEFLETSLQQGRWRAEFRYYSQVASFLPVGGAERMLGIGSFRPLRRAAGFWFSLFAVVAGSGLWAQPFTPVPGVIVYLAIILLASLDSARRTGYLRTGFLFGAFLGVIMFLTGAWAVRWLHLPGPPLSVLPVLPLITVLAFATVGAAAGQRFRRLGEGLGSLSLLQLL